MKGEAKTLLKFLDGSDNRFIIPVYQRNYDWKDLQCKQLFDDLTKLIISRKESHFFGSIVSTNAKSGGKSDFLIIDGQQRITTISVLFVAIVNLFKEKKVAIEDPVLCEKIEKKFLIDEYRKEDRKLRLKPIKDDCIAFDSLLKNIKADFVEHSNITQNYYYFYNRIQKNELSIEQLYTAIEKLIVIDIFLHDEDDPQLIFESLNSTGLELTEADKIRNYILMGLSANQQEAYYEKYWNRIEKNTNFQVSSFIRDYLTLKERRIPSIRQVYFVFKEYVQKQGVTPSEDAFEDVLKDILRYSEFYKRIVFAKQCKHNKIETILSRLAHIEMTVVYPFLLAILSHQEEGILSDSDIETILTFIESFVFRRLICNVPTNALNKIFCTLDNEIQKLKNGDNYVEVFKYLLLNKKGSSVFPDNEEFINSLKTRDIYRMNKKNKEYLFDRLENKETVERVNVITLMDEGTLSIEHIMPQTLNPQWKKDLGEEFNRIYNERINTLSNLTLTGYNSKYKNKPFITKRDIEKGFKDSGLQLNKIVASQDAWTEKEMVAREKELCSLALKLWTYPDTTYSKPQEEADYYTMEDDVSFTGREIIAYTLYDEEEKQVSSWVDMFIEVAQKIYVEYPGILRILGTDQAFVDIKVTDTALNSEWAKIDSDVYIYKANSTSSKIRILTKIFDECGIDKNELELKLKPENEGVN
jgi:uncharacterized protein with ParB-like and HNH nuclease domain